MPNVEENVSGSVCNVEQSFLVMMTIVSHAMTVCLHVIRKLI